MREGISDPEPDPNNKTSVAIPNRTFVIEGLFLHVSSDLLILYVTNILF